MSSRDNHSSCRAVNQRGRYSAKGCINTKPMDRSAIRTYCPRAHQVFCPCCVARYAALIRQRGSRQDFRAYQHLDIATCTPAGNVPTHMYLQLTERRPVSMNEDPLGKCANLSGYDEARSSGVRGEDTGAPCARCILLPTRRPGPESAQLSSLLHAGLGARLEPPLESRFGSMTGSIQATAAAAAAAAQRAQVRASIS